MVPYILGTLFIREAEFWDADIHNCQKLNVERAFSFPAIINKKASWRWQTRATQKDAKISLIRSVSFHFTEFHFPNLQITLRALCLGSRPILLYTVWNPVFANYKVSCLNFKLQVLSI